MSSKQISLPGHRARWEFGEQILRGRPRTQISMRKAIAPFSRGEEIVPLDRRIKDPRCHQQLDWIRSEVREIAFFLRQNRHQKEILWFVSFGFAFPGLDLFLPPVLQFLFYENQRLVLLLTLPQLHAENSSNHKEIIVNKAHLIIQDILGCSN